MAEAAGEIQFRIILLWHSQGRRKGDPKHKCCGKNRVYFLSWFPSRVFPKFVSFQAFRTRMYPNNNCIVTPHPERRNPCQNAALYPKTPKRCSHPQGPQGPHRILKLKNWKLEGPNNWPGWGRRAGGLMAGRGQPQSDLVGQGVFRRKSKGTQENQGTGKQRGTRNTKDQSQKRNKRTEPRGVS